MTRPVAVAITGGIGAGKSEALAAFARHGAATVSSDEIVHELLRRDEVREAIVERFGNGVVAPGRRSSTAARWRRSSSTTREQLDWLEKLLHPLVARSTCSGASSSRELRDPPRVCVTEVPLLYEAGARGALRQGRRDHRAARTCGMRARASPPTSARARLLPDEEKVARADYAYVNTGTLDGARRVRRVR